MKSNLNLLGHTGSPIRTQADLIASTRGSLNFSIGESDLNAPQVAKAAMKDAIDADESHYTSSQGNPELAHEIVNYYKRRQNMALNPDNIIITIGGSEALATALGGLLNPGEKVIVPTPSFPQFITVPKMYGGVPLPVDTSYTGFKITPELLDRTLLENDNVKALILNDPNNPVGVTYTKQEIKELATVIEHHDIIVISDELHAEFDYTDEGHYSIYNELPDQNILVGGLSKSHAMTGYRIGFCHVPDEYLQTLKVFHQGLVNSVSTPGQYGGIAAYKYGDSDVENNKRIFQNRLDLIYSRFIDLDLQPIASEGTFYLFPSIPESYGNNDVRFVNDLLQHGVGVIPGSAFGPGGEGHFRFSYATKSEDLTEGLDRISNFLLN